MHAQVHNRFARVYDITTSKHSLRSCVCRIMLRWIITLCVLLSVSAVPVQNLMINGDDVAAKSEAPYVVALLQCSVQSDGKMYCGKFCTGSLIAPNVVLTAGHCVYSSSNKYRGSDSPVPVSGMYAMAGSVDVFKSPGPQMAVDRVENHGYSMNIRYRFDQDIGLVFLKSAFTLVPGVIETINVATLDTEPSWSIETPCANRTVTSYGFGIMSNLPSAIAQDNGKLKSIVSVVHPPETCSVAYVSATFAASNNDVSLLNWPQYSALKSYYYSYFVPEYHLCSGGDVVGGPATCFGDSGGPVVINASDPVNRQLVGTTSFGVAGYCGLGPDYSSRVAPQAIWIYSRVGGASPPPVLTTFGSSYTQSRCTDGQWQCDSGLCIPANSVCDGTANCPDSSDEGSDFCLSVEETVLCAAPRGLLDNFETPPVDSLDVLIAKHKLAQAESAQTEVTDANISFIPVVVGSLLVLDTRVDPFSPMPFARFAPVKTVAALSASVCATMSGDLSALITRQASASTVVVPGSSVSSAFSTTCAQIGQCNSISADLKSFCASWTIFIREADVANTLAARFTVEYQETCAGIGHAVTNAGKDAGTQIFPIIGLLLLISVVLM